MLFLGIFFTKTDALLLKNIRILLKVHIEGNSIFFFYKKY